MEGHTYHIHEDEHQPLRLYFIPYLAAGHMIPHCDIARLFASRGHHVTVITTPANARIILSSVPAHPNFKVHTVNFPSQEVGLPDGIESLSAVSDQDNLGKVFQATTLLRESIEDFVERDPPDCIIADFLFPWVEDLAKKLHIPRLAFNGFCLFAICAIESLRAHPILPEASPPFLIQNLPHRVALKAAPPEHMTGFLESMIDVEMRSNGLIVNNFAEMDGEEYVAHYERTTGHKAWHLGPASLLRRTAYEKAERGQKSVVSVHECMTWLDSKRANSVLYVCFGSLCHFPDQQLYEIACALEASGCKFIWVVPEKKGKEDESEEEKEKWLPKGFEERNGKNKGMIIRGWAPQVLILGHPAVGAFVTHCGWNSTVESVSAGVPMITWPVHGEQFYNEKLITDVRGIGVEVGAEEWNNIGFGERVKLIGREKIEKAVKRLMDGGDEAEEIRRRTRELAKKARAAVEEGGSSHQNLTALINNLKHLRDSKAVEEWTS